jgi:hypothetical protein
MTIYRIKGASGAVINQSHTLGARTLIGRADDCDIRVDENSVAPHHAELLVDEQQGIMLKRMDDAAELQVNGESVSERALTSGDEIRIANCRWVLQAPGLRPEKMLTPEAVRKKAKVWPWLSAAAIAVATATAWYLGYLPI